METSTDFFHSIDQPALVEMRQSLAENTIDLDGRRGAGARRAARMCRQRAAIEANHAAQQACQAELDQLLLAAPAAGWVEAVAKARYLLVLLAQTPAAEDMGRARLIADVFADFERLLAGPQSPLDAGDAGLAPASLVERRIAMAKSQLRSNREAKKPKKEKPKTAAATQAAFGLTSQKSQGTKDDRGKKK